jgi:Tfp pilus assembly protein FimV
MKWKRNIIAALLFMLPTLHPWQTAQAESKRIEVYALGQQYWDTQSGETLGEIVQQLLPNNPRMHPRLMKDIVALNPDAFQNNNPDRMRTNTRIWLPSHLTKPDTAVNRSRTRVESFAWGNIKRPIR